MFPLSHLRISKMPKLCGSLLCIFLLTACVTGSADQGPGSANESRRAALSTPATASAPSRSSVASSSSTSFSSVNSSRDTTQSAMAEDLVSPNASDRAEAVYDYLRSVWGSKVLSGQQDLTWRDSIDMY